MPRFAVLIHDHPSLHWDFLLEDGERCRTWRLLSAPDQRGPIPAEPLPDHRLMYLTYEGSVSGDRGTVTAFDRGSYDWITNQLDSVAVRLRGGRLNGVAIVQVDDNGLWQWSITAG